MKLKYDGPQLSSFAFNFNVRHYKLALPYAIAPMLLDPGRLITVGPSG